MLFLCGINEYFDGTNWECNQRQTRAYEVQLYMKCKDAMMHALYNIQSDTNVCFLHRLRAKNISSLAIKMDKDESQINITKLEDSTETSEESTAHEQSSSFASPWNYSDMVLVIDGQKFHVHKCILAMNSPVFERMFNADFKEQSASRIELPEKSTKEFEVLLKMIYSDDKTSMIESK